ncbi:MAG TPA: GTPase [Candidatus Rokubacteria bacterium]|nr:GTPase [Candidatus Rokubacteria bacterium]
MRAKVIIMGAAGRDFHNFNVYFRDNANYEVVAFTATQIPNIDGRKYPASLAGKLYPRGIDIYPEKDLPELIKKHKAEQVIFAYSDIAHVDVMHKASIVNAVGADFRLMGGNQTAVKSKVPVIAICAVRTGSGKSQTTRAIATILRAKGRRVVAIRHPMPYGDLEKQAVQRFATYEDLDKHECTIEEREEYEPHLDNGVIVYAGVDYEAILRQAEQEVDIVLWDGGNNDFPFVRPDLHIVMADALRPGQAAAYHPGEAVLRMADVVVVNKVDVAAAADVERVVDEVRAVNPRAPVVRAASPVRLDDPARVRGRRVLVVEDGPTITHGGMPYGAGFMAATRGGAAAVVDPRESAHPDILAVFARYPHIGCVLPAVGYGAAQLEALRETINSSAAEVIVAATPMDLAALIRIDKPVVRARYEYADAGEPTLGGFVDRFLAERAGRGARP